MVNGLVMHSNIYVHFQEIHRKERGLIILDNGGSLLLLIKTPNHNLYDIQVKFINFPRTI